MRPPAVSASALLCMNVQTLECCLLQTEDLLVKRRSVLEKKMEQELQKAKEYTKAKNKRGMIVCAVARFEVDRRRTTGSLRRTVLSVTLMTVFTQPVKFGISPQPHDWLFEPRFCNGAVQAQCVALTLDALAAAHHR